METLIKNKKAVMQMAILLLTAATMVLAITSLFIFNYRVLDINKGFESIGKIAPAYVRAEAVNFMLNSACSKIASTLSPLADFKNQLAFFGDLEDLKQINSQIDSKHITLLKNKVSIKLDLQINQTTSAFEDPNGGLTKISYSYQFKCSKTLPPPKAA